MMQDSVVDQYSCKDTPVRKTTIIWLLVISFVLALIFIRYPEIDLYVSGLFFKDHLSFYLAENPFLLLLHNSVTYITISIAIILIAMLIIITITKKNLFGLTRLRTIYLLLALILGPGLVVNTIFKDHWGRARPSQVTNFSGDKNFTPAFIISDQCERNCSFVSGDPSVGFYFFAFAFAIKQRRKLFTTIAFTLGSTFAATRLIQGKHFFSDVIFSGIFTFLVVYFLYIILLRIEARQLNNRNNI